MPDRESPNGLNAEPIKGWVHLYGPYASTTLSADSARRTAERLWLAAGEADIQREQKRLDGRAAD